VAVATTDADRQVKRVGGRAMQNGVTMMVDNAWAVAARRPDGTIGVHSGRMQRLADRYPPLGLPFVRGAVAIVEQNNVGRRAAAAARRHGLAAPPARAGTRAGTRAVLRTPQAGAPLAAALGVWLWFLHWWWDWSPAWVSVHTSPGPVRWLAEQAIWLLPIAIPGVLAARRLGLRRAFEYHGAEHQAIACYESGRPLTPHDAGRFPTAHPRCGSDFAVFLLPAVLVASRLLDLAGWRGVDGDIRLLALLNIPRAAVSVLVACMLAYEVFRFVISHDHTWWGRLLTRPGIWLQAITTKPPTAQQREVAIAALRAVVAEATMNGKDR
jgi:uncharacterized protein YqhQ